MTAKQRRGIAAKIKAALKANLIAGLLVAAPLAATVFLLRLILRWGDKIMLLVPEAYRPESYLPFDIPGLGIFLLFALLFLLGILARNILGRTLVRLGERIMGAIPLVNKVYQSVKQLMETVLVGGGRDFKRVVLVEYPRRGIYALAYVTGKTHMEFSKKNRQKRHKPLSSDDPQPDLGLLSHRARGGRHRAGHQRRGLLQDPHLGGAHQPGRRKQIRRNP